jgi:hypothetical protein
MAAISRRREGSGHRRATPGCREGVFECPIRHRGLPPTESRTRSDMLARKLVCLWAYTFFIVATIGSRVCEL